MVMMCDVRRMEMQRRRQNERGHGDWLAHHVTGRILTKLQPCHSEFKYVLVPTSS